MLTNSKQRGVAWAGTALIVALVLLIFGLLGAYLNIKYEEVIGLKSKKLERVVACLELKLSGSLMAINLLAGDMSVESGDTEQVKIKLQNAVQKLGLRNAALYDVDGNLLTYASYKLPDHVRDRSSFDKALQGEAVVSNRIIPGGQEEFYVSLRAPVYDQSGAVTAVLTAAIPTSDLSSLVTSEDFPEGQYIFILDANGRFIYHPRFADIFPEEDAYMIHLFPMSPTEAVMVNRKSILDKVDKVFIYRQLENTMWRVTYAAPIQSVYLETVKAAVPNIFVSLLVIVIFALMYAYVQIDNRNRRIMDSLKLERLAAATDMAAGIAHEVRNPLTSIKGFIQLMLRKEDKSNFNNYLDIMLGEIERIDALIGEFQILARPLRQPNFMKADLGKIVSDVVFLMEAQAEQKGVTLEYIEQGDLFEETGVWVKADVPQIKQVLINLIKNALDASPTGGRVIIRISKVKGQPAVLITDKGCGMDPEVLKKIGTPFFTTKEGGTGLGLSICFTIIHNHNGQITVDSTPEQGTTFTVRLPDGKEN